MARANRPCSTNSESRTSSWSSKNPLHEPVMRYPPPVKALLPLLKTPVHPRPIGTVQGVQACAKSAFFLLLLLPGVYRVPACACIPYILSAGGRAADSESVGIDSRRRGRTGRASKRRGGGC